MEKIKKFFKEIAKSIVRGCIYGYCKIVYRVKIIGKENVPKDGAVIFSGNHRTYLDPPLIVATAGRDMRFLAKEELRKNPFFRVLGIIFDGIYVKRDAKDLSSIKESLKTLKSGNCIGLFPEGTRNGLEKNGGKVKNGASYLALKTNAKIVPIGIVGSAKPFTKNAIIYGKPLEYSNLLEEGKKVEKETEDKVTKLMMDEIIRLSKTEI